MNPQSSKLRTSALLNTLWDNNSQNVCCSSRLDALFTAIHFTRWLDGMWMGCSFLSCSHSHFLLLRWHPFRFSLNNTIFSYKLWLFLTRDFHAMNQMITSHELDSFFLWSEALNKMLRNAVNKCHYSSSLPIAPLGALPALIFTPISSCSLLTHTISSDISIFWLADESESREIVSIGHDLPLFPHFSQSYPRFVPCLLRRLALLLPY